MYTAFELSPDSQLAILLRNSLSIVYSLLYCVKYDSKSEDAIIGVGVGSNVGVGVRVGVGEGVRVGVGKETFAYDRLPRGLTNLGPSL